MSGGSGVAAPASPAGSTGVETMTYREALRLAMRQEMERDERVFVMGEEVGLFDGSYKVTAGLMDEFGPDRVRDTPISEEGFLGAGVGAAMLGERPIVEVMTLNFLLVAMDQVVNHAAKVGAMFGGEVRCPLVIRTPNGAGNQLTAQHSQSFDGWFAGTPGLKVVAPATPADAKGLLKAAIRDDDPVLVIENLPIYKEKGEVDVDTEVVTPIFSWKVAVGDEVAVGQEIAEIETDKANMGYEADVAGTLTEILAEEGDALPIGSPIAVVGGAITLAPEDSSPTDTLADRDARGLHPPTDPPEGPSQQAPSAGVSVGDEGSPRVRASPLAKRIARANGVDPSTLSGSGPGGRIVKADVESVGVGEVPAPVEVPAESGPPDAVETAKGTATYEATVIGQSDPDTGLAIRAFVTLHGGVEPSEDLTEAIREGVAARIGEFARRSGSSGPTTCRRPAPARSCAACSAMSPMDRRSAT